MPSRSPLTKIICQCLGEEMPKSLQSAELLYPQFTVLVFDKNAMQLRTALQHGFQHRMKGLVQGGLSPRKAYLEEGLPQEKA